MKLSSSWAVNIADLRTMAQRRAPKVVFDYLDGGAEDEITLGENSRAFRDITFRPRQAIAFGNCETSVQVLGTAISIPAVLAPVGYSRMMHPGGEVAAARAAGEAGTAYVLSTISGHKLEDVRAATGGPIWYQLYLVGGRGAAEGAIERAKRAGYTALVITVDTAVAGNRERDPRNGMKELLAKNLVARIPFLPNILAHPRWLARFLLDGGIPKLHNIVIPGRGPMPLVDVGTSLAQSTVTWADFAWIRELWNGPIVVKGVLSAEDARKAVGLGAAAVVVSNHGGRQLDEVSASIRALPEIVAAVGTRTEVLMDGGVRRGGDIVKALCLGARAVLVGRAYAYGLAAAGYGGVVRAIGILRDDVERTLRLLGCPSVAELNESYIEYPCEWRGARG